MSIAPGPAVQSALTVDAALDQALSHHLAGRLAEAEALYRCVLAAQPRQQDALHLLGVLAHQVGRNDLATDLIRQAIAVKPDVAAFHNNLGATLRDQDDLSNAASCFAHASALDPSYADAHANLAGTLAIQGRLHEAADSFRRALKLRPESASWWADLGEVLHGLSLAAEAEEACDRALAIQPQLAQVHNRRGLLLQARGKLSDAAAAFHRAAVASPDFQEAHFNLGVTHQALGRLEEAAACYRRALEIKADYADALVNLGVVLQARGQHEAALESYWRAVDVEPEHAGAHNNLGTVLQERSQFADAAVLYRRAIQINPDHAGAHNNLGSALSAQGLLKDAELCFRRTLEIDPGYLEAHCNLGGVLQSLGRHDEAIKRYRQALALEPDYVVAHCNLIFALDLHPRMPAAEVFAERRRFNGRHARPLAAEIRPHPNSRDPERPLRIGYVSADFRHHSAATTFSPVLFGHDHERFRVICYSGTVAEDDMTRQLEKAADEWRSIVGVSDEELAEQIRADCVDIMVDLSSFSSGGRLLAFARKPAPIQVSAWGYAVGTGLDAVDYFFGDPVAVPPEAEHHFSETVIHLPSAVAFQPPINSPPIAPPPARTAGAVTFGSFNRLPKITSEVLDLWARVLREMPESRLMLKYSGLEHEANRQRMCRAFRDRGVEPARIECLGATPRIEHLAAYNQVDLVLDPFPHGGGVTALEGLWMGVPLVTMLGEHLPGRLGASILTTLGLPELIAHDADEYLELAVTYGRDIDRLVELRPSLRQRLAGSVICDGPAYCRAVEDAYRAMWRRWCAS